MRPTERMRQRRRARLHGRRVSLEAGEGAAPPRHVVRAAPKKNPPRRAPAPKRRVDGALAQRMRRISKVVDKVIDTKVKVVDWEARPGLVNVRAEDSRDAERVRGRRRRRRWRVSCSRACWPEKRADRRRSGAAIVDAFALDDRGHGADAAVQTPRAAGRAAMGEALVAALCATAKRWWRAGMNL